MKVPFAISPLYQCPLAMRRQSRARHVRRRWSLSEAVEINVWNKELRNMSPVFVSCFVGAAFGSIFICFRIYLTWHRI